MAFDYNIALELSALPFDVILCAYIFMKNNTGTPVNKYFRRFAVMVIVGTVMDIVSCAAISVHRPSLDILHYFLLIVSQLAAYATSLYFVVYAASYIGKGYFHSRMEKFNFFLNILYVLLVVQNLFTGNMYAFVNGRLVKGPLWMVTAFLFPLYFIIFGIGYLAVYRKNYRKEQKFALMGGTIMAIGLYIVQMFFLPNLLLTFFIGAVGELILLLTFETPDYSALMKAMEELKIAREKEKEEREKADQASRAKSKFLNQMSHEIKTPINAILGYDDLILKDQEKSKEVNDYAEKIKTAATGLLDFFSSVISYVSDQNDVVEKPDSPPPVANFKEMPVVRPLKTRGGSIFENLKPKPGFPEQRILIIDDNDMNVDLLIRMLRPIGIRMDAGENGKDAVDMLRHRHYDLVFMDHMMPVMDGMEAMKIIRATHLCDASPVIMMTANNVSGEEEKYIKAGFADYVIKPFDETRIYEIMLRFLPLDEKVEEIDWAADTWDLYKSTFSFLDTEISKKFFEDDEEFFLQIMNEFVSGDYADKLSQAYEKKDFYRYSCTLQALRENCDLIGAKDLSSLSRTCRNFAESNDTSSLAVVHPQVVNSYQGMVSRLRDSMSNLDGRLGKAV